ncbi:hypothetical protein KKE60_05885 [Patescibacteria group bacterium]|nr:hypothetical protein [Patescibacteria group bacterium]
MRRIFKKFWYAIPVVLSLVALLVVAIPAFGAETDAISDTLVSNVTVQGATGQIDLEWSLTQPLVLYVNNAPTEFTITAVSLTGSTVPAVLHATYDAAAVTVEYFNGSTWVVLPTATIDVLVSPGVDILLRITPLSPAEAFDLRLWAEDPTP